MALIHSSFQNIENDRRRLNAALVQLNEAVSLIDAEGRYIYANPAFCKLFGYELDELPGSHISSLMPPEETSTPSYRQTIAAARELGEFRGEVSRRAKDGRIIPILLKVSPFHSEQGELLGYIATLTDLTEIKRAENTSLEREKHFRDIIEHAPLGTVTTTLDGRFIRVNQAFCDIVGYSKEALNNISFSAITHPDDIDISVQNIQKLIDGEIDSYRIEKRYFHANGHIVWAQVATSLQRDPSGNPQYLICQMKDFTAQKQAEDLLHFHNDIFKNLTEGIFLIRASDGAIVFTNPQFERMFGYESGELLGKHVSIVNAPSERSPEEVANAINSELAKNRVWSGEVHNIRKDGTTFWCHISVSAFYHPQFWEVWVAEHKDISERGEAAQNQKKLTRALTLLSQCGTLLIHAKNEQRLLEEVCQLAVVSGGYLMAWVGLAEHDTARSVRPVAQSGYEDGYLDSIKVTWSDTEHSQGPTGTAIKTRATVINQNCLINPDMAPWREAAIRRGYQSSIALPLVCNEQVLGALTIYSAEPWAFTNAEVALLKELANNLSYGIGTLRTRAAHERAELESRELAAHLQTVREEERFSLAREIHDELGSTLAALKIEIRRLERGLSDEQKATPLFAGVESMANLLDDATKATRRIVTDLRPPILDENGLQKALEHQAGEFQKRTGIECRVACIHLENNNCKECKDCGYTLDKALSFNLFRIFQESLTNVARHSGASRVEALYHPGDNEIVLSISDNGCGLPESHAIASTSNGIRGMRERVSQLGGEIRLDSPPGSGFKVTVKLPQSVAPPSDEHLS